MEHSASRDFVYDWFARRHWKPHGFQEEVWERVAMGKSGMLNAPTGMGKTYALWIPLALQIADYLEKHPRRALGFQVLWITPLRSLSQEIAQAAKAFAEELHPDMVVDVRTGDVSSHRKKKQAEKPPHLLITTPESLQVLLAQKGYSHRFRNLKAVVVDEWHELMGNKRGVQVQLALSRLRTLNTRPRPLIWGISATIANLAEAKRALLGPRKQGELIKVKQQKSIEMHTLYPSNMEAYPWAGHSGLRMAGQVAPLIDRYRSTLIFCNTRSQAELWYQKLLKEQPDLAGLMALHHGSLEKDLRQWVEEALSQGLLKAVVCTSSLDLGVDFRPVEAVVQVGSPKGVARFMQRAGRSNHQPGKASRIYFVPTHALEVVEAAALRQALEKGIIEARPVPYLSYDVLAQYLCTLAVSEGFYPDPIYQEVKQCYSFQAMTPKEWADLLDFLLYGGDSLYAYNEYKKLEQQEDGRLVLKDRKKARRHRMAIGTIVSDPMLKVKYLKGGYLGSIEEWFVSQLKPGEQFWFAGRPLQLVRVREMKVLVRRAKKRQGKTPAWLGGRLPLSSALGKQLRERLHAVARKRFLQGELRALKPLWKIQESLSHLPRKDELLLERLKTREGHHLFVYPFAGRKVHQALAALLAYRMGQIQTQTFSMAFNDYGFELLSATSFPLLEGKVAQFFKEEHLLADLQASLNATEMARRKFRDIAVISGLVFQGSPKRKTPLRHLQSGSSLLFEVFRDHEPSNLLFRQAHTEAFEYEVEEQRLRECLRRIRQQRILVQDCKRVSPLAFPIMVDRLREKLSSEKLEDRIGRLILAMEKDVKH